MPSPSPSPVPLAGEEFGTEVREGERWGEMDAPRSGSVVSCQGQPRGALAAPREGVGSGGCGEGVGGELSPAGSVRRGSGRCLLAAVAVALAVPFDCLQMLISITWPLHSHLPDRCPRLYP